MRLMHRWDAQSNRKDSPILPYSNKVEPADF